MKKTIIALALIIAFLLGCVVSQMATNYTIPPARADMNATKWEYMCQHYGPFSPSGRAKTIQTEANEAGAEGWEMFSANEGVFCFKRPLPQS